MAKISGRAAFLSLLASEGVRTMFGNPGTTELPIMEALGKQSAIQFVLGLQEALTTTFPLLNFLSFKDAKSYYGNARRRELSA